MANTIRQSVAVKTKTNRRLLYAGTALSLTLLLGTGVFFYGNIGSSQESKANVTNNTAVIKTETISTPNTIINTASPAAVTTLTAIVIEAKKVNTTEAVIKESVAKTEALETVESVDATKSASGIKATTVSVSALSTNGLFKLENMPVTGVYEFATVHVFNIKREFVKSFSFKKGDKPQLDLKDLPAGIYTVVINDANDMSTSTQVIVEPK